MAGAEPAVEVKPFSARLTIRRADPTPFGRLVQGDARFFR
jgi:hypothetical protein